MSLTMSSESIAALDSSMAVNGTTAIKNRKFMARYVDTRGKKMIVRFNITFDRDKAAFEKLLYWACVNLIRIEIVPYGAGLDV